MLDALLDSLGLKELLPEGPLLTPWARRLGWPAPARPAAVTYTGDPRTALPAAPPVLPFGVRYDLDIVLVTDHPDWHMHEYARIGAPDGQVTWLAKDARAATLNQSVVTDRADVATLLPELPLERRRTEFVINDRSDAEQIDLQLAYTNLDGEPVEIRYEGPAPRSPQAKRNGSTMGHSRSQLLAVLDLSHRDQARRAEVVISGRRRRITRILGLVPFQMALSQTQGGLTTGRFRLDGDEAGVTSVHAMPGEGVEASISWRFTRDAHGVLLTDQGELRTLQYRFIESGDARELASVTVTQWDDPTPTFHMALDPALPDLRRPFSGRAESRYVMDVNGQPSHAVGRLAASWQEGHVRVELIPEAPWWTADRPMETVLRFDEDGADVVISIRG